MDTATAKQLLQSTDIQELQTQALSLQSISSDTDNDAVNDHAAQIQLIKLQILLWNRVLQLQVASSTSLSSESNNNEDDDNMLQHNKNMAVTVRHIAEQWSSMGEFDRAIGQWKKALVLDPHSIESMQALGDCHVRTGAFDLATEQHVQAILAIEMKHSDSADHTEENEAALVSVKALAYCRLAQVYDAMAEFEKAADQLAKAVNLMQELARETTISDPSLDLKVSNTSVIIYRQLGALFEKTGDYKQAADAYEKAWDTLIATKGEDHEQTKQVAYHMDMMRELGNA